jgi:hypothetical protein
LIQVSQRQKIGIPIPKKITQFNSDSKDTISGKEFDETASTKHTDKPVIEIS